VGRCARPRGGAAAAPQRPGRPSGPPAPPAGPPPRAPPPPPPPSAPPACRPTAGHMGPSVGSCLRGPLAWGPSPVDMRTRMESGMGCVSEEGKIKSGFRPGRHCGWIHHQILQPNQTITLTHLPRDAMKAPMSDTAPGGIPGGEGVELGLELHGCLVRGGGGRGGEGRLGGRRRLGHRVRRRRRR